MAVQSWTTCPTDCSTGVTYGALAADQSCILFDKTESQINRIYFRPDGAADAFDYTTPTAPATVSSTIDNTNTDNTKVRELVGIGGVDVPEKTIVEYHDFQTRTTKRMYTLIFRIDNLSQAMYDFCQLLQCGDTDFTFRYSDMGGFVYGGTAGIVPASVDVDMPKGAGKEDTNYANLIITFEAVGDPHRAPNPY